jgi:hypothetical protein
MKTKELHTSDFETRQWEALAKALTETLNYRHPEDQLLVENMKIEKFSLKGELGPTDLIPL